MVNKLLMQKIVAFDTETEGLDSLDTEIVGISFSWIEKKGFYVPIENSKSLQKEYFEIMRPFFENKEIILELTFPNLIQQHLLKVNS